MSENRLPAPWLRERADASEYGCWDNRREAVDCEGKESKSWGGFGNIADRLLALCLARSRGGVSLASVELPDREKTASGLNKGTRVDVMRPDRSTVESEGDTEEVDDVDV